AVRRSTGGAIPSADIEEDSQRTLPPRSSNVNRTLLSADRSGRKDGRAQPRRHLLLAGLLVLALALGLLVGVRPEAGERTAASAAVPAAVDAPAPVEAPPSARVETQSPAEAKASSEPSIQT